MWARLFGTFVRKIGGVAETINGNKTFSGNTTFTGTATMSSTSTHTGLAGFTAGLTLSGTTGVLKSASVTLTNAQMLALRATPITVVAAPGAGKWNQILGGYLVFDYTGAYTETADNMALRYVDGSGAKASADIECTGFVDATADAITNIAPLAQLGTSPLTTAGVISNAAIVIHNIGDDEFGGGNAANTVKVSVFYIEHTTGL